MAIAPGAKMGTWTVIRADKPRYSWCRCDCGTERSVRTQSLIIGQSRGCGCAGRSDHEDQIGRTFGSLTVIAYVPNDGWLARCICGGERIARPSVLRVGHCGCLRNKRIAATNTKHGGAQRPEYRVWRAMRERCASPANKRFADYGGRGIRVCAQWDTSFEAFFADMGPRPSSKHQIDRIDNDGNYEPTNCRWATPEEQQRNTRRNVFIEHRGEKLTIAEWHRRTGLPRHTIARRRSRGLPSADILAK